MPRTGSRFKYRPDGGTADKAATIFRRYGAVPHALAQKTRGKASIIGWSEPNC